MVMWSIVIGLILLVFVNITAPVLIGMGRSADE